MLLASITHYQVWLSIHILCAVLWVGANFAIHVFFARMNPEADPRGAAKLLRDTDFIGNRMFAPLSLILVVMGFILVSDGDWPWKFWIFFGIAVWLFSFAVGVGYLGRKSVPTAEILESDGYTAAAAERMRGLTLVSRIEFTLLVLVVLDMALKPGA